MIKGFCVLQEIFTFKTGPLLSDVGLLQRTPFDIYADIYVICSLISGLSPLIENQSKSADHSILTYRFYLR